MIENLDMRITHFARWESDGQPGAEYGLSWFCLHHWEPHTLYSINLFLQALYEDGRLDPAYMLINQRDYIDLQKLVTRNSSWCSTPGDETMTHYCNQMTGTVIKIVVDPTLDDNTLHFTSEETVYKAERIAMGTDADAYKKALYPPGTKHQEPEEEPLKGVSPIDNPAKRYRKLQRKKKVDGTEEKKS